MTDTDTIDTTNEDAIDAAILAHLIKDMWMARRVHLNDEENLLARVAAEGLLKTGLVKLPPRRFVVRPCERMGGAWDVYDNDCGVSIATFYLGGEGDPFPEERAKAYAYEANGKR
jgi:hypothetical protein